jgi:ethanolamine ammonia-lyase small subunit
MEWADVRRLTAARIGLQRSGASLGTRPLLEFRLAHARARDAVHAPLDENSLLAALPRPALIVSSRAEDRRTYLMRPDFGRELLADDAARLAAHVGNHDLAIVVGDGLSAAAAERHAPPLLEALLPALADWSLAPLVVARHARVALGDQVAAALGAASVLVLIGERPGLSAPDSLGAYLTWAPRPGTTDAERNCVSNIRPDGLDPAQAARTLAFLLARMRALRLSGVALKDESDRSAIRQVG